MAPFSRSLFSFSRADCRRAQGSKRKKWEFRLFSEFVLFCPPTISSKCRAASRRSAQRKAARNKERRGSAQRPRLTSRVSCDIYLRVRPYYAENTTSRPICEVKQRQAQVVLRSVMTRELWVSYSHFSQKSTPVGFRFGSTG